MSAQASEVTRIKIINNKMYADETEVVTFSARDAFISFLYFLKIQKKPCILLAHNCFR